MKKTAKSAQKTVTAPIRLVFADQGSFHELVVELPTALIDRHERIIDALREEPEVTARVYVDPRRLVAAYREPTTAEG